MELETGTESAEFMEHEASSHGADCNHQRSKLAHVTRKQA